MSTRTCKEWGETRGLILGHLAETRNCQPIEQPIILMLALDISDCKVLTLRLNSFFVYSMVYDSPLSFKLDQVLIHMDIGALKVFPFYKGSVCIRLRKGFL